MEERKGKKMMIKEGIRKRREEKGKICKIKLERKEKNEWRKLDKHKLKKYEKKKLKRDERKGRKRGRANIPFSP